MLAAYIQDLHYLLREAISCLHSPRLPILSLFISYKAKVIVNTKANGRSLRQIMYINIESFSTIVSSKTSGSIAEPCPQANLDCHNMGTSVNETRTLAHFDPCNKVLRY